MSYKATVQGNGNLLIGKAYTAMLDLEPGDEFEIKLGKKAIRLIPQGDAAAHSEAASGIEEDEGSSADAADTSSSETLRELAPV